MKSNIHNKFILLYSILKENRELNFTSLPFKKKARLFSIPIFNRILFVLTTAKLILEIIYFIYYEKSIKNFPIFLSSILFIISIALLFYKLIFKYFIYFKIVLFKEYQFTRIIRIVYLFIFFYQQNYVIYYYGTNIYEFNPGFIFSVHLITFFFESSDFSTLLFYIYIFNFFFFIAFFSASNFVLFMVPIIIVIVFFVLVEVVGHTIAKKLIKSEIYFTFFEKVIYKLANEGNFAITYDNKVIFPTKNLNLKQNESNSEFDSQSEMSFDQDLLSNFDNNESISIPIEDFDGFEIVLSKNKYSKFGLNDELRKSSFNANLDNYLSDKN